MPGKVTTFYSYKGGSGRSMTLANVAWALATNGQKVLCIDWDLEAPGLHRYFHPFLDDPEQKLSTGLIDLIWEGLKAKGIKETRLTESVQPLTLPSRERGRSRGRLHLLGAGRQDDEYAPASVASTGHATSLVTAVNNSSMCSWVGLANAMIIF